MEFVTPQPVSFSNPPALNAKDLHIWIVRLPYQQSELCARRDYLRSFRAKILAGYLGCPHARVTINYQQNGQPKLTSFEALEPLSFSTSYTDTVMALAVSSTTLVGIDIEEWTVDGSDMVANYFSPEEHSEWTMLREEDRPESFYRAWTLKEAYLKACGIGLSGSLSAISVNMNPRARLAVSFPSKNSSMAKRWFFASNQIGHNLTVSVAIARKSVDLVWLMPTQNEMS